MIPARGPQTVCFFHHHQQQHHHHHQQQQVPRRLRGAEYRFRRSDFRSFDLLVVRAFGCSDARMFGYAL